MYMENNVGQKFKVSVLIPCRNEAGHIESCLNNIYGFDAPAGDFEVIVIDGMSTDGTRDIYTTLRTKYPGLIVLDNPQKTVPHGMNLGIMQARGEYIVRADVRCVHPKNYLTELIGLMEQTGADNAGGVLVPAGVTYTQQSIALAYKSPIALGGALRDRGDFIGETDAVYGGCFKKSRLIEVGLYDERMIRNQDDELSFRLRKDGGKVIQSGRIKIQYFPRKTFKQLFKQFLQYGYWKVFVLEKHPRQASWRHYMPALLVAGFGVLGCAGLLSHYAAACFFLYTGGYLVALAAEALRIALRHEMKFWPGIAASIFCIHTGFGTGFLFGLANRFLNFKSSWFESLSR